MQILKPEPGLVISFSYLWRYERAKNLEEGRKNRPCVIVLAIETNNGKTRVIVAPITHTMPDEPDNTIEIPPRVKQHLGLDDEKSWVIISEVNSFIWPGFDIREIKAGGGKYDYGFLPPKLFAQIRDRILKLAQERKIKNVSRD